MSLSKNYEQKTNYEGEKWIENKGNLKAILKAIPDLIFIFDAGGVFVDFFTNDENLLAAPRDKIIGKDISEFFPEKECENFRRLFKLAINTGEIQITEYTLLLNSRLNHFESKIVPVNGNKVLTLVRDITLVKRSEMARESTHKISEAINSVHSLKDLFTIIHNETAKVLSANNFYIALYDANEHVVEFPYFVDEVDEIPQRKKAGRGLTEYVIRTGKSLLATPDVFEELVKSGEVESIGEPSIDWLGVPLKVNDTAIGAIVIQTYKEKVRYSQEDKEYLEIIASQAATAIRRKQIEEEQVKLNELILTVAKAQEILLTQADTNTAINKTLEIIGKAINADRVYIFEKFVNPSSDKIFAKKTYGWCSAGVKMHEVSFDLNSVEAYQFFPEWTEIILNENIVSGCLSDFNGYIKDALTSQNIFSILIVPIFIKNELWGVVGFDDCKTERRWTKNEITVINTLTNSLGNLLSRKKAEETTLLLAHTMESVSEIVSITDLEDKFTFVNNAFLKVYGYTFDEVIGKHVGMLWSDNNSIELQRDILSNSHKENWRGELLNRTKDGKEFPISLRTSRVKDGNGNVIGLVGIAEDITERKKTEEELRISQATYLGIINSVTEAIYVQDQNGRFLTVNRAAEKMYGYPCEYFVGKTPEFLSAPGKNDANAVSGILQRAINGIPGSFEFWGLRKDGSIFPKDVSLSPGNYFGEKVAIAVARDISARKKSEEELKATQEQFKLISDNTLDIIWIRDLSLRFTYVSPSCFRMKGFTVKEVMNSMPEDILTPGSYQNYMSIFSKELEREKDPASDKNRTVIVDGQEICKDGRIIWTESLMNFIRDKEGNAVGILGVTRDITERKKAEELLAKEQALMKSLMDTIPDCIYFKDTESRYLSVNKSVSKIFNLKHPDDVYGKTDFDFFHFDHAQKTFEDEQSIISNGNPMITVEERMLSKDHNERWFSTTKMPMFDESGNVTGIFGVSRDITEKKITEESIRKSEERYRLLADNIGDVIFTLDLELNFKYVSPSVKILTGYNPEEVLKKHFSELLTEPSYKNTEIAIKEEFHKNYFKGEDEIIPNRVMEVELIKKNNVTTWVEIKSSFLRDEKEIIYGILGVARDISLRKHAEQEIIRAKEKAEEVSRLKTSFLSNMSHELRTPLVAILGSADILTQELSDPLLKKWAGSILTSGKRLLETQNLILDLSKIEAEKVEVVYSIISVESTIKEVVTLFEPLAVKKGLALKTEIKKKDIKARLDEKIVREVLYNLVNNAIKYTENGDITISLNIENEFATISVKDTGIGIPKEKLPIIFEEFRQVSEGRNRSFEGTGLGLTITKRFVELLKGNIEVKSKLGVGTEFVVKFPVGRIDSETTVKAPARKTIERFKFERSSSTQIKKILLVEDDTINSTLISYYLSVSFEVTSVDSGIDAVKKATEEQFDIILMDINLGRGMNGLEATQQIRSIPGYEGIPVVAITAFAMQGDREEFLAHGCTHYISKPFEKNELLQLLSRIEAELTF